MITKTIADIKKYAKVASGFTYDLLEPEISDIADNEIANAISTEEYTVLEAYSGNDSIVLKAIELIKKAEVNLAMFNYLPVGSIQVNKTSVSVITPQGQTDATQKDLRDALRLYRKKGYRALDNLLALMEKNEAKFPAWVASNQYTNFKDLLVNNTSEFQEHYNIFNSRQTFLELVPEIKIVEQQFIIPAITPDSLQELKTSASTDAIFKLVKNYVAKSIVLFTVSKNLGGGQFYQSANGFELRFDMLDYERKFTDSEVLSEEIHRKRKQKYNEANEFLKLGVHLIKENANLFNYTAVEVESKPAFINGKGSILI